MRLTLTYEMMTIFIQTASNFHYEYLQVYIHMYVHIYNVPLPIFCISRDSGVFPLEDNLKMIKIS